MTASDPDARVDLSGSRPGGGLVELLRRRRMTRRFDGGPTLEEILFVSENALRAPSAGFSQGVHLVVLTGADLSKFWLRSGADEWFVHRAPGVLRAPCVVLVLGDCHEYVHRYSQDDKRDLGLGVAEHWQTPYWIVDAGMVAQNFLLLAEERRWGALFFGVHGDQGDYFAELGIPSTAHCIGAIAVGFRSLDDAPSGSSVSRPRRGTNETVHVGSWRRNERAG